MPVHRFGALEFADGALWLGAPRARLRRGGIRLGADALSQWGGLGRRDTAWDLVSELSLQHADPKRSGGVEQKVARVLNVAGLAMAFMPDEFRELNGGIRVDWVAADADERCWGVGGANWEGELSAVEVHAATAVLHGFCRSTRFRQMAGDADAISRLFDEFAGVAVESEVDSIVAGRS